MLEIGNKLRVYLPNKSVLYAVGLSLLTVFLGTALALADSNDKKFVSIYDRGEKTVLVSNKKTVREVLEQAEIKIEKTDAVEPELDSEVTSEDFNINIYRSKPVTIVDGLRRIKVMTPYDAPEQILRRSGVELYPEDIVESRINYNLAGGVGSGIEYVIRRATQFNLIFYGKVTTARTQKATIDEYLDEKGIKLASNDRLSLDRTSKITSNMRLEIWREGKQEVIVEEEIPYKVRKKYDYNRDSSYHNVEVEGVNGKRTVVYEVDIKNGQEISRKELNSLIITEPIEQIEVIGMKIKLPAGGYEDWMRAAGISEADFGIVNYIVSRESGWRVNATNPSSGAYGLPQALPGNKMASAGSDWETNPITQLKWMQSYVNGRYYDGSPYAAGLCAGRSRGWDCAYAFWQVKHWY